MGKNNFKKMADKIKINFDINNKIDGKILKYLKSTN